MIKAMMVKVVLIILLVQAVRNDIDLSSESSCVNDDCTTAGIDLPAETLESVTETNLQNDFSTEMEHEQTETEENFETGYEPKLKSSSDGSQEKFHIVKHPSLGVLTVNNKALNKNSPDTHSHSPEKELNASGDQSINKQPRIEAVHDSKSEKSTTEISTQLNLNTTNDQKNETNTNTTKEIYHKHHPIVKNQSEICTCDLKVNECDINCCCDRDCNANMKTVFTTCVDSVDKVSPQFCFNSRSIFKNNLETNKNFNGLFCIVRNNLHPHIQFTEEMVINNVTKFNKMISRKKLFTYSPLQLGTPELQKIPYRFGDFLWSLSGNKTVPFEVPKQTISMQCKTKQNIHYLTDYETQCLRTVPSNREKCISASELGMEYYLRGIQLIRSPAVITSTNSSDKVCSNKTCVPITPYVCPQDTDFSNCVKSTPRRLLWDSLCKNIVFAVEYQIYHNGTDGIKEARVYFTLRTFQKESFVQKIRLKFFWVKTRPQVFTRSGNPGYIIGKPIMAGRKVYGSNETMSIRKEAIELSYNPEDWLTVVGTSGGACSSAVRRPIGFGENARHTCFVDLGEFDYLKKKCVDLQDFLFNLLLRDDFAEVKLDNSLNKFVATFGNSGVEDTGDWVQVIIDVLPMVSSQVAFASHSDFVMCKNIISDLFIDVAYAKVGSFDKPQNKILGVHMYFGSPTNVMYYINPNCSGYRSSQNLRLSTYVHFIDLTREPQAEFAETPGFEAKLPHDFFYPFFSGSYTPHVSFFLISFVCLFFVFVN